MRLEIKKAGINGEGIGFYHHKPVFVPGCFPGEIVACELKDAGRYYEGKLQKVISFSEDRIPSPCPLQNICGSCALLNLDYPAQLQIKKQLLQDALYKYAGYDKEGPDIIGSPAILHYRNKCNMPIVDYHGTLSNALYARNSNRPIMIDECLIHAEGTEKIRRQIISVLNDHGCQAYDRKRKSGFRQLVVRGFGEEYQAVLITGNDRISQDIIADLKAIKGLISLYQGINTSHNPVQLMPDKLKRLYGKEKIEFTSSGYRLCLSPQAFFQLNQQQAERIYHDVSDLIDGHVQRIVEAYCGIGAISLYLHDKADELTGIEVIDKAVKDAKENAELNGFDNLHFICDDAPAALRRICKDQKVDILVVDPPRTGLDERLLETIRRSRIDQVIYISCNPVTLARDIAVLKGSYRLDLIRAYDMFPGTPHVESICLMSRK